MSTSEDLSAFGDALTDLCEAWKQYGRDAELDAAVFRSHGGECLEFRTSSKIAVAKRLALLAMVEKMVNSTHGALP